MSDIEVFICLILLLMAVPDVCRKLNRPALAYSFFVLFGLLLNPVATDNVAQMLITAGKVGFLLLLFEVGLEIELPSFKEFLRPFLQGVEGKYGMSFHAHVLRCGIE